MATQQIREVKEILSGMALATGIVDPRFPLQNRRLTALPLTHRRLNLVPFGTSPTEALMQTCVVR